MKKKLSIILLIITAVIGSIVTFYATNLLMSDVPSFVYGFHDNYIFASFPLLIIAIDFVILYIFILRYTRYPIYKKSLIKLYSMYLLVFSSLGIIFSILTGTIVYHSFIKPYPFPLYTIICLLVHLGLLVFSIYIRFIKLKDVEDDKEKKHIKVKYVIYSAFIFALTIYAFYRFGGFILSPIFIQLSTLNLTIYFYISLLCPIACLIHVTIYFLDGYKNKDKQSLLVILIIGFVSISLETVVLIIGYNHTEFISAISQCLPLERLATKPIGTIIQLIFSILFSVYYIAYSACTLIRNKKAK